MATSELPDVLSFDEFASVKKEDWLRRVEKDLKTRTATDLRAEMPSLEFNADKWHADPFAHADDCATSPTSPTFSTDFIFEKKNNHWLIAEAFRVPTQADDFSILNKKILTALMGGVGTVVLKMPEKGSKNALDTEGVTQLFENVHLDYIQVIFDAVGVENIPAFLQPFCTFAQSKGIDAAALAGGTVLFEINNLDETNAVSSYFDTIAAKKDWDWVQKNVPAFKVLGIEVTSLGESPDAVADALSMALLSAQRIFETAEKKGMGIEKVAKQVFFTFVVPKNYLLAIAQFRAFRLLWGNLLAANKSTPSVPTVSGRIFCDENDPHTKKIETSTKAMSAAIGGVSWLVVDNNEEQSDFERRIARNVQNILQLESHFDHVLDPAAGSYYIEQLTEKLAEAAWQKFQNFVSL